MQACYLADLGGAVLGAAPQVDCRRVYEGNTSLRVRTRQVLAFRPLFPIVLPILGARLDAGTPRLKWHAVEHSLRCQERSGRFPRYRVVYIQHACSSRTPCGAPCDR